MDWITDNINGSYEHIAEPLHAMEAISIATEDVLSKHATRNALRYQRYISNNNNNNNNISAIKSRYNSSSSKGTHPLFFYLPFTAAHSPLQPLPRHLEQCLHIPHILRRDFCGMVMGIDESLKNLTDYIFKYLPSHSDTYIDDDINHNDDLSRMTYLNSNATSSDVETTENRYSNTIMVVLSDNGGSPWFGGLNTPLRGTKGDLIMIHNPIFHMSIINIVPA